MQRWQKCLTWMRAFGENARKKHAEWQSGSAQLGPGTICLPLPIDMSTWRRWRGNTNSPLANGNTAAGVSASTEKKVGGLVALSPTERRHFAADPSVINVRLARMHLLATASRCGGNRQGCLLQDSPPIRNDSYRLLRVTGSRGELYRVHGNGVRTGQGFQDVT